MLDPVCAAVKGMVSKRFSLGKGIEISRLGLQLGIIFQETDQLLEEFSLDWVSVLVVVQDSVFG